MSYKISADTGGTFIDVVVQDPSSNFVIGKALTTEHCSSSMLNPSFGWPRSAPTGPVRSLNFFIKSTHGEKP